MIGATMGNQIPCFQHPLFNVDQLVDPVEEIREYIEWQIQTVLRLAEQLQQATEAYHKDYIEDGYLQTVRHDT